MSNVFKKISWRIKALFDKSFNYLKEHSEIAVRVTQQLKYFVESPVADLAVQLIPYDIDNKILDVLKKVIPEVALKVGIAHGILVNSDSSKDAVTKVILFLRSLNKEGRVAFWIEFSARLNESLSDGKIDFTEAIILSQLAYKEFYK